MKRPVRDQGGEPERWTERLPEATSVRRLRTPAEDDVGALLRRVRDATLPPPPEPLRAGAAWKPGLGGARFLRPLALAAVVLVASGGVVKAARAVWRAMTAQPQSLIVPSGSSVVLNRRRHRKLTVVGPARLELDRGGADRLDATLEGGALTAEAGDQALQVQANGLALTVPAGASGRVAGSTGGAAAVDALAGELEVVPAANGQRIALQAGHRWPELLAPVPAPPAPAAVPPAPAAVPARAEAIIRSSPEVAVRTHHRGGEQADSEGTCVARAFQALRVDRDAQAALRELDDRARRFPDGVLADEARVARVEALLMLGRTTEALPLLLEIRDRSQGLTREIQLARAEILAEQNRCSQAIADFDDLMAAPVRDDAGERALYGRAGCRLRAGETTRARLDLLQYIQLYPEGRFIGAVRRAARQVETVATP
ncbi:MAG TPA: tetratricopeptide repeat protein [Polyangia bacterium]|nr:tetratricopeptide repeat protein [Polyangia bacterium]